MSRISLSIARLSLQSLSLQRARKEGSVRRVPPERNWILPFDGPPINASATLNCV